MISFQEDNVPNKSTTHQNVHLYPKYEDWTGKKHSVFALFRKLYYAIYLHFM
jgi:hypothetical protein